MALLLATEALAQEATAASQPAATNDEGIADVIITAQRRTENVQRASVEIDVVGAGDLERSGISSAYDLNRVVPGLQIGQGGPFTQTFVRGVGTNSRNQYGDPTVTFNQDGVVIDRPNAIGPIFYDLARVEVLKGPQGTLYGRNATGGAINILTQEPARELGGFVSAELGDYHRYGMTGALNLPIGETLALRGSVLAQGRDSYLKGGFPDGSSYADTRARAGRLQALWRPNDDLSLRLIGEASTDSSTGDGIVLLSPKGVVGSDKWLGAANTAVNALLLAANPTLTLHTSDDDRMERDLWNIGAEFNWNLGPATLTVIPAYRHAQTRSISYDSGNRLDYDENSRQKSVEARLSRESDRYHGVIGAFYFDNDREVTNYLLTNPINQVRITHVPQLGSDSWAGFGDITVTLVDGLRTLGGVRYTHENKVLRGFSADLDAIPTANYALDNQRTFEAWTWRGGFEYDLTPHSMGFLTVARGFKSGGFYTAAAPGNAYDPEVLTAYTLGIRNRFLNDTLQVNAEAFHWRYKDNQQSLVSFDGQGNVGLVTLNAGSARLSGLSLDVLAKLSPADTLSLNAEYVDSKYTRFEYPVPALVFNPVTSGCLAGAPYGPPGLLTRKRNIDCSGFPLPRAPKTRAQLGYEHAFRFGEGSALSVALNGSYVSSQWLTIDYVSTGRVDETFTGDVDLTFTPARGRYNIAAFVHNVTNEAVYSGGSANSSVPGLFYGVIGPPRTYGLRARVDF